MLKKLALILALVIPTTASADRTYDIKAVRNMKHVQTCGATVRMMKDKHRFVIKDDGSVWINGMKWDVVVEDPDLVVTFHRKPGQRAYLFMEMYVNRDGLAGRYVITSLNTKRQVCWDEVYIEGIRR